MSLYETQEPLEDDIQEHALGFARHVDIAQADAAAQPSVTGSSPNFHVFYHAYNELYRRSCELLQFAQSRGINDGAGLIGSVTDELQNQKSCLSAFDDYLKNVWVRPTQAPENSSCHSCWACCDNSLYHRDMRNAGTDLLR